MYRYSPSVLNCDTLKGGDNSKGEDEEEEDNDDCENTAFIGDDGDDDEVETNDDNGDGRDRPISTASCFISIRKFSSER